jgi:RNA polymerase sigma factor (sigma-70 family)
MGIDSRPPDPADQARSARFEATFDAHHVDVLAYAMRRVDGRAAAEDVVAETFAVVWRRRDVIPEVPLMWLYGVARKVVANQRRSAKRGVRLRERLAHERGDLLRVADPALVVEARENILAALSRLSVSHREVLRLVAWEGVDTKAGAEILECSPIAFRMRLHRARRELQRQLEAGNDDASPAANPSPPASATEEAR